MTTSRLELSLRCEHLSDQDFFSKSDPVAILLVKSKLNVPDSEPSAWSEVSRTEVAMNTTKPVWNMTFMIDHDESIGPNIIRVAIYDWDNFSSQDVKHQTFLGLCQTSTSALISTPSFQAPLKDTRNTKNTKGKLFISVHKFEPTSDVVNIQLSGTKLDKKDFFGKSDPFFVLKKRLSNDTTTELFTSEVVKNNLNPTWKTFTAPIDRLCNNNVDRAILIDVFDADNDGSKELIGSVETTLRALEMKHTLALIHPEKKKKKGYKNSGQIHVLSFQRQGDNSPTRTTPKSGDLPSVPVGLTNSQDPPGYPPSGAPGYPPGAAAQLPYPETGYPGNSHTFPRSSQSPFQQSGYGYPGGQPPLGQPGYPVSEQPAGYPPSTNQYNYTSTWQSGQPPYPPGQGQPGYLGQQRGQLPYPGGNDLQQAIDFPLNSAPAYPPSAPPPS